MPGLSAPQRAAVLEGATQVFADRGYARATLAEVAAVADVAVDAVARAFSDTATLLMAVLTGRDDGAGHQVRIFENIGGLELLHALTAMVRADSDNPNAARLHTRITAEAIDPGHPAHLWAVERYTWTRSLFAAAIRRDAEAGRIRADVDPRAVAGQLIATMDGLQLQWLLDGDAPTMADAFEAYTASLARWLGFGDGDAIAGA